jgi:MFS family permease
VLSEIHKHLRHNFFVGVIDGSYFGLGLGLASSVTVLPLFVSTLTDETTLIGLIAAIQAIGWQLPQLFTAVRVSRLPRYKPMAVMMSFHERWPFFGLAVVAFMLPTLGPQLTLLFAYLLLICQALGGGFTATAWQSMTGKIIPPNRRGTFWGMQAAGVSLLQALGAILAGMILVALPSPIDFALCFLISGISMLISWIALARTREPESEPGNVGVTSRMVWGSMFAILRRDRDFRWFIAARALAQITSMALAFYTIYGVRRFGMDEQTAGIMTAVLMLAQMTANPIIGWAGDRWSADDDRKRCSGAHVNGTGMAIVCFRPGRFL